MHRQWFERSALADLLGADGGLADIHECHDRLRTQWRPRAGRTAAPTAAVLDAQSTRSSPQGGEYGYDAGKKVKGRKRNRVIDTLGLLLAVSVTAASGKASRCRP